MRAYISHYIAGRTEEEIKAAEAEGLAFANVVLGVPLEGIVLPRRVLPWCTNSGNPNDTCPPGRRIPGDAHTIPCYLRADFLALLGCDAIVMTKGWETSYGAAAELQLAVQAGIAVHFA